MALRPGGKVKKRPRTFGKPQKPQKGIGRPKPGSKQKGPVGGPKPKSKIDILKEKLRKNPVRKAAMGGQASEGAAKSALVKRQKTARQKEMMDMLRRLYGKQKIVPKKKPKKDK